MYNVVIIMGWLSVIAVPDKIVRSLVHQPTLSNLAPSKRGWECMNPAEFSEIVTFASYQPDSSVVATTGNVLTSR